MRRPGIPYTPAQSVADDIQETVRAGFFWEVGDVTDHEDGSAHFTVRTNDLRRQFDVTITETKGTT